jgi:hypothetical protein
VALSARFSLLFISLTSRPCVGCPSHQRHVLLVSILRRQHHAPCVIAFSLSVSADSGHKWLSQLALPASAFNLLSISSGNPLCADQVGRTSTSNYLTSAALLSLCCTSSSVNPTNRSVHSLETPVPVQEASFLPNDFHLKPQNLLTQI